MIDDDAGCVFSLTQSTNVDSPYHAILSRKGSIAELDMVGLNYVDPNLSSTKHVGSKPVYKLGVGGSSGD